MKRKRGTGFVNICQSLGTIQDKKGSENNLEWNRSNQIYLFRIEVMIQIIILFFILLKNILAETKESEEERTNGRK